MHTTSFWNHLHQETLKTEKFGNPNNLVRNWFEPGRVKLRTIKVVVAASPLNT